MRLLKNACFAIFAVLCAVPGHLASRKLKPSSPFFPPPGYKEGCASPKEGLWTFQNNFQVDGAGAGYTVTAISEVRLVKVAEGVYNGTGLLHTPAGDFVDAPVSLVGLFNPRTCYLTGTGFLLSPPRSESYTFWSTGTTLYGPYLGAQSSILLSPLLGITNATFIGEKMAP